MSELASISKQQALFTDPIFSNDFDFYVRPEQSVAHMQSFICRIGEIREIGETGYSLIYHAAFSATGRHMTASNHCEWFVS